MDQCSVYIFFIIIYGIKYKINIKKHRKQLLIMLQMYALSLIGLAPRALPRGKGEENVTFQPPPPPPTPNSPRKKILTQICKKNTIFNICGFHR